MTILGIETSCDETALCVIEAEGQIAGAAIKILANITLSQAKLHAPYGGVFPNLAKREHIKNLPVILKAVLTEARMEKTDVVAVTYGPGLEPCLWAGISFAQALAEKWAVPLVPVNHMEGHIYSALLRKAENSNSRFLIFKPTLPALALLISGGHTELDLMEDYGKYRSLGETRDDAVGEAFDKVARLLGLPYPGGPEISRFADAARFQGLSLENQGQSLPRPMLHSHDYDFSFSGLKTAVLYLLKKIGAPDEQTKAAIACGFEDAVTEVLITKTRKALRETGSRTLIVAGGVIANMYIRREMQKCADAEGVALFIPELAHTTDNALMIAVASYATVLNGVEGLPSPASIRADGTAKISTV